MISASHLPRLADRGRAKGPSLPRPSWRLQELCHGFRTTIRELDELIKRTQSAIEREASLNALSKARLRREKQQQVRAMRIQLRRLRSQRSAVKANQPPSSRLR
jgi:hypothetical protein